MSTNKAILNELLQVEIWADGLKEHCRKARKLIQAGVSTPAPGQNELTERQLAGISARRKRHILKKTK